jgi:hypothetical protein
MAFGISGVRSANGELRSFSIVEPGASIGKGSVARISATRRAMEWPAGGVDAPGGTEGVSNKKNGRARRQARSCAHLRNVLQMSERRACSFVRRSQDDPVSLTPAARCGAAAPFALSCQSETSVRLPTAVYPAAGTGRAVRREPHLSALPRGRADGPQAQGSAKSRRNTRTVRRPFAVGLRKSSAPFLTKLRRMSRSIWSASAHSRLDMRSSTAKSPLRKCVLAH